MRVYLFFLASALAAALAIFAPSEQQKSEPSESQMKLSFGQFFSELESRPVSEIQFITFKKHSCKPTIAVPGHICNFTYIIGWPDEKLSILRAKSTFSGTFFLDGDGHLKFETVIG